MALKAPGTIRLAIEDYRSRLPASRFPEWADVYFCDNCARDVTTQFRPHPGHTWTPMGPERFSCICGAPYLTGAVEWDHLDVREQQRRIRQTFGLGAFLSLLCSIPGIGAYFVLSQFHLHRIAVVAALLITGLPLLAFSVEFWVAVAASVWRTRMRD